MPRLLGVDIPNDKKVAVSLTYLYGVGSKTARALCHDAGIPPEKKARELAEDELGRLSALLERDFVVEGQLQHDILPVGAAVRVHDATLLDRRNIAVAVRRAPLEGPREERDVLQVLWKLRVHAEPRAVAPQHPRALRICTATRIHVIALQVAVRQHPLCRDVLGGVANGSAASGSRPSASSPSLSPSHGRVAGA